MSNLSNNLFEARRRRAAERALEGYQGWANYETWCVHLWLDNDEGLQAHAKLIVRENEGYAAEEALREYVQQDLLPSLDGFAGDLMCAALDSVDWQEVVTAFREES